MTELVLHEAAANGEWQTLESMLMIHRIDVDHKDEDFGDRTALHWAASRGHAKCVKLLLEYGADPSARMVGGWTPAHCAAETGRLNVLKVLIDQQSAVLLPDNSGDMPKRVAEIYGHAACVELLQSAEESSVQRQHIVRDKFRTNTRKISRIVAEKGVENIKEKLGDIAS
ncbi:ankyrin repeat domain-containing protein 66-like [Montipora capricornis]|uniref:ankyrin repeat domain-containing protein 66-like n=1 Tax=Montipora foliosa TaxID=591990 RepID=UPI0035F10986